MQDKTQPVRHDHPVREGQDIAPHLHGLTAESAEAVSHPAHYGGKDNVHETIKCIEAWGLGYTLGNAVKYISRAGKKETLKRTDLEKAVWYVMHETVYKTDRAPEEMKKRMHEIVDQL